MTDEPPPSFMASEMAEQPQVLERLIARASSLRALAARIAPRPLAGCAIVARGSSDHAALLGRYLFEVATGRPVSLVSPSVHTIYRAKVDYKGILVLGVSQSGATPEIVEVLERLRDAGARTVALTDDPTSPLAAVAEEVVDLNAGPERAVPATKTVTATMLACILLAEGLADHPLVSPDALNALPEAVAAITADDSAATAVATQIDGTRHLATVARGYLFGAAIECALKIRETTGILANGWSAADLRHGPVAAIGPDVPILSLRVAGPAEDDVRRLEAELAARGARIFSMTDAANADLPLPAHIPEPLASIAAVVRGQQLAFSVSTRLGIDPDQPLGLHKVTQHKRPRRFDDHGSDTRGPMQCSTIPPWSHDPSSPPSGAHLRPLNSAATTAEQDFPHARVVTLRDSSPSHSTSDRTAAASVASSAPGRRARDAGDASFRPSRGCRSVPTGSASQRGNDRPACALH